MKKKIVSIMAIALSAVSAFSFAACGKGDGAMKGDAYNLVFYRARSNNMADGTYDDDVTRAIEEKFFQDKGVKIALTMKMYSGDDLPTQVDTNFAKSKSVMEGVAHYISEDGGSAILKYARVDGSTIDVEPLLNTYGQHILSAIRKNDEGHLAERAGYVMTENGFKMNIIPGVEQEKCYAMLVRKDMMKQVFAKTGVDPDEYDVLEYDSYDDVKHLTFSQFDSVMRAIKENVGGIRYSITGAPWDIGRTIAPVFGVDYNNSGFDENGKFVPPQLTENYDKYLSCMYEWARDGIWESESVNMNDDKRMEMFFTGTAACYIAYPEITNLIAVARQFNAVNRDNTDALMLLAPLADDEGNVNGYFKESRGFQGMILPYKANNAEVTIQFLDWMYEDQENYDLCKYGVKGVHWEEGDDVVIDGKTYKTWQYPAEKQDEFSLRTPYSGMWELVPNINVSNRINGRYNTNEKKWYAYATNEFESFSSAETESVWMAKIPKEYGNQSDTIGEFSSLVRAKAWAGITDAEGRTPAQALAAYKTKVYANCQDYLRYIDDKYREAVLFFDGKFGS